MKLRNRARMTDEMLEVELPGPDGRPVRRRVTKKWFDEMVAKGMIRPDAMVAQEKRRRPEPQSEGVTVVATDRNGKTVKNKSAKRRLISWWWKKELGKLTV